MMLIKVNVLKINQRLWKINHSYLSSFLTVVKYLEKNHLKEGRVYFGSWSEKVQSVLLEGMAEFLCSRVAVATVK